MALMINLLLIMYLAGYHPVMEIEIELYETASDHRLSTIGLKT